jgi:SLT domain-containing protein
VPTRHLATALLISSLLAAAACGCSLENWPSQLRFTPPFSSSTVPNPPSTTIPPPSLVTNEQKSATATTHAKAKSRRHKRTTKKVAAQTAPESLDENIDTTDTSGKQEDRQKPTPAVTLVGGAAEKRARASVVDATERLSKINRNNLKGENVSKYDQVRGFVDAARHALDERNYELAFALASKATKLTDELNQKVP